MLFLPYKGHQYRENVAIDDAFAFPEPSFAAFFQK